jgi:dTDP-4-amino-4,6-dideoxygalactose transaminase
MNPFQPLFDFEKKVADYFGAPYAVATDCCTHALEMCLVLSKHKSIICPKQTYISVPFMLERSFPDYIFSDIQWREYYHLTADVIDAATYWKALGYIKNTKMCLSFHIKKHLNIGRGGMVLLDDENDYKRLQKMRYDGRSIYDDVLYEDEDIKEMGYHYYMTPETAKEGLRIFEKIKNKTPKNIGYNDYPDLTQFTYFKNKYC